MRNPIVAGQFYDGDFDRLDRQIRHCFESKLGPGALPVSKRTKSIFGIISPHAGYMFSGQGAAWAFKEIAEAKFPDLFIILGLSHSGYASCISQQDWETPLGIVKNDADFSNELMKNLNIKVNERAHSNEHSIEVQLPFLQFVNKDKLNDIKIAPIIVSDDIDHKIIAQSIYKTIKNLKRSVQIIASSDFTHYGLNYGFFPFQDNVEEKMYKLDKEAIKFIESLNSDGFKNYVEETGATICGRTPISVVIELCKLLGAKKARLLHYYTSGDVVHDYSNAVGYASIVFE